MEEQIQKMREDIMLMKTDIKIQSDKVSRLEEQLTQLAWLVKKTTLIGGAIAVVVLKVGIDKVAPIVGPLLDHLLPILSK